MKKVNLKEILKKIAEGKELTPEEKSFLQSYEPDSAETEGFVSSMADNYAYRMETIRIFPFFNEFQVQSAAAALIRVNPAGIALKFHREFAVEKLPGQIGFEFQCANPHIADRRFPQMEFFPGRFPYFANSNIQLL